MTTYEKHGHAKVNDRHIRFARAWFRHFNGKKAAIEAGYKEASATSQATRLLCCADVQTELKRLREVQDERDTLTIAKTKREIARVAYSTMGDVILCRTREEVAELDDSILAAIKTVTEVRTVDDEGRETTSFKVQLHSKPDALGLAAKVLGMTSDNRPMEGTVSLTITPPK